MNIILHCGAVSLILAPQLLISIPLTLILILNIWNIPTTDYLIINQYYQIKLFTEIADSLAIM